MAENKGDGDPDHPVEHHDAPADRPFSVREASDVESRESDLKRRAEAARQVEQLRQQRDRDDD
jgi:hypothetical protein